MICDCKSKVEETIKRRIDEAKNIEFEQKKKLDQFQDGIRKGAQSQISRMIYRLGIYQTSLDNDCKRNITHESIMLVLDQIMKKDPMIYSFYSEQRSEIFKEDVNFDNIVILRPLIRIRKKAPGLLTARINREMEGIKKRLEGLEKLEKSLQVWKEGTRREQIVESILITDLHH